MASEDVIELGSSDDEAEPAPKKIKPSSKPKPKPKPNAMVHIPNKLHGVTIKPTKPSLPNIPGLAQKTITVTKVSPSNNYSVNKTKVNGQPAVEIASKFNMNVKPLVKPIPVVSPKVGLNPMTLMKKLNTSQVVINKVQTNPKLFKQPVKYVPRTQLPKNLIQIRSPRTLNNLPPSITIKRSISSPGVKRPAVAAISNTRKKQKVAPKGGIGDVLTVELDDDESLPSTSSPQWYLRPEQQTDPLEIEAANNKEPDPPKFIEITIEDSPVKPTSNKRACEVGTELAITIEDSPIKHIQAKPGTSEHSDDEMEKSTENDEPNSKKKLEYPKETEININNDTIEIEIEPITTENSNKECRIEHQDDAICIISETFEDPEVPVNKSQNVASSTPKKENRRSSKKDKETDTEKVNATEIGEFHPVYQSFIDLCLKLEDSDDMKKIVDKKIKGYYRQVPKEYTESEEFIDMVSSKVISIKAGPEKMYLYIKDIVDELNLQRKMAKAQPTSKETKSAEADKFLYGEESEFDTKRQRQIRKLEKTLKKLHRAIQKLEEQEVDFDDEEDSVYLLTERYKERMVRVHAKFCQLTNTKMPSEPRVQLDARPGMPSGAAKRLEKWINRKVPSGTPLPFPDFHDVLRCVREANTEDKLGWNEADIMEEARDLFTRCGKKLQRRRQENEWRLAASRIAVDIDPAEQSDDLKKKLEDNKKLATKKETEVFNKYADRQSQLKLEAEEIGDKEAEESPVESEEEEPVESSALENKEKRKERIRRIINEKSKKNIDEVELKKSEDNIKTGDIVSEGMNKDDNSISDPKNDDQKQDMEIDSSVSKHVNDQTNEVPEEVEAVQSISDESNQVGSEIDELHLLQKLHSGNEISSTVDSSDTDTPIDISDTLQSSSDNKGKQTSDVISIENSSYSESENNKDTNNSKDDETDQPLAKEAIEEIVDENVEADNYTSPKKRTDQTNNDEYNDTVENILLASSDDEPDENKDASPASEEASVNLKDDAISIGDTVVEGTVSQNDEMNVVNENGDNISEPEVANDNSEEIVFVSESKKEEAILNGAANDDTSLSSNLVQNAEMSEISEVSKMTEANEVEATGSKEITNSGEAMEISVIGDNEGDNNTSIKTKLENNNLKKDELSNIAEESTIIPSESNVVAKSLVDKNDLQQEKDTNDKEETVDSLIDEIRSDLESQETLKESASSQQNNEL